MAEYNKSYRQTRYLTSTQIPDKTNIFLNWVKTTSAPIAMLIAGMHQNQQWQ